MIIRSIKTDKIRPNGPQLLDIIDGAITTLPDNSVVVVTSKIVSICEGRVVKMDQADKDHLIKQETAYYLPRESNPYRITLTIAHNILAASGGIDESNGDDYYILWPANAQATANLVREHLTKKHGVTNIGVIITDSSTRPLQWGTTGIGVAHSGFEGVIDYRGSEDIFGRAFHYQKSSVMNGLAAAAVMVMGEGNEQTPLAIIEDVPFVVFQPRNPTAEELKALHITLEEDLYGPVLKSVPWEKGDLSG